MNEEKELDVMKFSAPLEIPAFATKKTATKKDDKKAELVIEGLLTFIGVTLFGVTMIQIGMHL